MKTILCRAPQGANKIVLVLKVSSTHIANKWNWQEDLSCRHFYSSFRILIPLIFFILLWYEGKSQATDPCGCTSWTTLGTVDESVNISDIGTIPDCAFISGQLVINQNTTWNNLRIRMDEGSEILVKTTLTITDSYLSTCDDMWKGIRTHGYPSFISVTGSTIEGAEFGIRLAPFSKIKCEYNDFIDDYIGITCGSPFEHDQSEVIIYLSSPYKIRT